MAKSFPFSQSHTKANTIKNTNTSTNTEKLKECSVTPYTIVEKIPLTTSPDTAPRSNLSYRFLNRIILTNKAADPDTIYFAMFKNSTEFWVNIKCSKSWVPTLKKLLKPDKRNNTAQNLGQRISLFFIKTPFVNLLIFFNSIVPRKIFFFNIKIHFHE